MLCVHARPLHRCERLIPLVERKYLIPSKRWRKKKDDTHSQLPELSAVPGQLGQAVGCTRSETLMVGLRRWPAVISILCMWNARWRDACQHDPPLVPCWWAWSATCFKAWKVRRNWLPWQMLFKCWMKGVQNIQKRSRQERGLHKRKQIVKERPNENEKLGRTINLELKLASFDHLWVLHVVTITVTVVLL